MPGALGRRFTVGVMPNVEQVAYWDGSGGEHWVAEQERYDQINAGFGDRVVEVLSPCPGERVLDVGCGNGALSLAIGPLVAPEGSVLGLDISGPMLARATVRVRAAGLENVRFERGDAQELVLLDAGFDAMVSRFGVMFFDDPQVAFANLARSLLSGGRVVFACWQDLVVNEWLMVPVGAAWRTYRCRIWASPVGPVRSRSPTRTASAPCSRGLASMT